MSGVTVSYRLDPRQHRAVLSKEEPTPSPRQARRNDRTARMLALAHHVEILVEEGRLPDYAAAARILGVTRARMTQVMNLLLLAPGIQEGVLLATLNIHERSLRAALREAEWNAQSTFKEKIIAPCAGCRRSASARPTSG